MPLTCCAGWVEREQHADYSETIVLPDCAFTLLEAFRAIQEQKPREFAAQLYTAHQLISGSRSKDFSPALAITQAYENVRQLVRGLNELNQNIRRYIERATRGRSTADLLQLQFDDYARTLGPTYHALKTSDHVSRYRRDIVSRLRSWQRNRKWLDRTAEELALQGRLTPAQAAGEIQHDLQFIYGGLNILAQLREQVGPRFKPYRMDIATLEAHSTWARPLIANDVRHLKRLMRRASLIDMRPLIEHMLQRELKLEHEAIVL